MLEQIPSSYAKTLKKNGSIEFRMDAAFIGAVAQGWYLNIPHRIVYIQRNEKPRHLFNCTISFLRNIMAINDIGRPADLSLDKAQEHLLLGLAVDAAESLSTSQDRAKVIISSTIHSIADILVDRDFVTRKRKNELGGFKGIKTIKVKDTTSNENDHSEGVWID